MSEAADKIAWATLIKHVGGDELRPTQMRVAVRAMHEFAALQSSRPVGGEAEPVAWMYVHPDYPTEIELHRHGAGMLTDGDKAAGWTETPLYTHPAPLPVSADMVIDRTIERLRALPDYAGRPAWDEVITEELRATLDAARAKEREEIAAWLRGYHRKVRKMEAGALNGDDFADAIATLQHKEATPPSAAQSPSDNPSHKPA